MPTKQSCVGVLALSVLLYSCVLMSMCLLSMLCVCVQIRFGKSSKGSGLHLTPGPCVQGRPPREGRGGAGTGGGPSTPPPTPAPTPTLSVPGSNLI